MVEDPVLETVAGWMSTNGLQVAPQKSEAVILMGKWAYRDLVFTLDGHQIPVRRVISYLGVKLDIKRNFNDHILAAMSRARKTAAALGRLMPNMSVPSQAKRSLLMSVVHSKLLYAAPV